MSSLVRSFVVAASFIVCVGVIGACSDTTGPQQPAPATVVILGDFFRDPIYVSVGDRFFLPVKVLDQAGDSILPRPNVVWSSSDTSIATVTQLAEFLAKRGGQVVIRAQVASGQKIISDSVIFGVQ